MAAAPRQRIRGASFKQEYQSAATRRTRQRAPSMNQELNCKWVLPAQDPMYEGKLTLALDLDETLVYAREGPLYARPGLDEFFKTCKEKCVEVVVWTAGLKAYAQAIIRNIDKDRVVSHCIYRHSKWFTGYAGYQKDLAALGRPLDRVLIIENTPDCIRGYQQNGILVEDYEGGESADNTIPALIDLIRNLCDSSMTVPQFIATCPMLKRGPIQTDLGDYIDVYRLDVAVWKPGEHVRINRDLRGLNSRTSQSVNENDSKVPGTDAINKR
ncbi:putative nuclear lim interactor-interacting factor [Trypanosoma theileri]|uniref:Mitochondrial import inner membrane translocase subunit TIM50 n=1 Tax=Trypanosoma theileri TaxID=67003 RepID=A0A1X0NJT2_9TRYP|nr:putative nuclear lim interactor-interacting factor [Trypanosoma theileri]ORC84713.1 putative nuclear lim interactor-interacting factor [Trypanosoma theileri]